MMTKIRLWVYKWGLAVAFVLCFIMDRFQGLVLCMIFLVWALILFDIQTWLLIVNGKLKVDKEDDKEKTE